jgi:hypothetical protein
MFARRAAGAMSLARRRSRSPKYPTER